MLRLEELKPGALVRGVIAHTAVRVVSLQWYGAEAVELIYKEPSGRLGSELLYRADEERLELLEGGRPWGFEADGSAFRLVSEAQRIHLAYLFDPLLAVHTSLVEPLPHQITAVYEAMLPRSPLRFLLADDPGAGKTIMTGLLIKELWVRGDVQRCLIVCPGNLVEQWQDELYRRFGLPFEIATNDKLASARSGNWFLEQPLVIARLDKLARDQVAQARATAAECRWDLVVVDEAHKLSASFFGGELKRTKRYRLGQELSARTRHFLLLTATPHNGKEEDFQLFLALLDSDRFEGRFRPGVHRVDVSDLMRRMIKEQLRRFDGRPLFPERFAHTVPFRLSELEARLYQEVTGYVRAEFNRADALGDEKRAGTVGFALTILQRRLASSPEAIYQSLRRRRERLEKRLRELELTQLVPAVPPFAPLDPEAIEDLEDAPAEELEATESQVLDQATAARSLLELRAEIATLQRLETLALQVRQRQDDRKWRELAELLATIPVSDKLVIFTEHRDTLNYLCARISTLLGQAEAVVAIHGGMGREERRKVQEAFLHDPAVRVLVATDAAGEGINLQRAHLMVNYDLPWNPNRIEQRFGRIHRIGQSEACHLWNLVALETREGEVYHVLLEKLNEARNALGGKVFDVLGKLQFEGKSLKELLIEAIRYGEQPEVKERLQRAVAGALDTTYLQRLVEERALAPELLDEPRLRRIREEMQRAEARRLQPHYIQAFFLEAFRRLGGSLHEREPRRFEVTHVPASLRGPGRESVLSRYERITFEKALIAPPGQPMADFIGPGHPLLDAVLDLSLKREGDLLRQGCVLVDEGAPGKEPRLVFYLEHTVQEANGERAVSRRMLYLEVTQDGQVHPLGYAPYLDYRPLRPDEPTPEEILNLPESAWIGQAQEAQALAYAVSKVVPAHLEEVRQRRIGWINKTRQAVKERLTKEIAYWDLRAEELRLEELAGKANARLNAQEARRRADELAERLRRRMEELDAQAQLSAAPPVVVGGFVVVPAGLLRATGPSLPTPDPQAAAARARQIVMAVEQSLGYAPVDRELERLGYDIESRDPRSGLLRFIEVKGRSAGAQTITVTRNEILTSLNHPEAYILAVVEFFEDGQHQVHYIRRPFQREPDFAATSVNYNLAELLARAEPPA